MSALAFTSPLANAPTARLYVCLFFAAVCLWRLIVNALRLKQELEADQDISHVREDVRGSDGNTYDPIFFFGMRVAILTPTLLFLIVAIVDCLRQLDTGSSFLLNFLNDL